MIRFTLRCEAEHEFDGWFRDGGDFDRQKKRGLVSCPVCNSARIEKALMAPAVSTARGRERVALAAGEEQRRLMGQLREMVKKVRENADYVGDRFAEEARKIHFGEVEPRGIYGEATADEARGLVEDGVDFVPLPTFPDDTN